MVHVPDPPGVRRHVRARRSAREALARVLWDDDGRRRLPSERALVRAIAGCHPQDVWWVCETSCAGPVYLLPTREWIEILGRTIEGWGAKSVLEVAAGDGFLASCLAQARPRLTIRATDDHSWNRVAGRIEASSPLEGVPLAGIRPSAIVERRSAAPAVRAWQPDLVLVSWAPPGPLVERVIRAPSWLVLDLTVDGDVCGDDTRTWRYDKELLEGPIERRALCRLDHGDCRVRATRATLYYGARHPRHRRD